MSTLLSHVPSVHFDNANESRRSFASTAFREDHNAELDAQAQHYDWWLARESEPAPLTPETAIDALDEAFPGNSGVAVNVEIARYPHKANRVLYNAHVHVGSRMISRCHVADLDTAVAEIIAEASGNRAA